MIGCQSAFYATSGSAATTTVGICFPVVEWRIGMALGFWGNDSSESSPRRLRVWHLDNARWRPVAAIDLPVSLTMMTLLSHCLG